MRAPIFYIREDANIEIKHAYHWYEDQRKGLGEKFLARIEDRFKRIKRQPELFPKIYKNYRQAIVIGFPYVVVFKLENNALLISAVFHTRSNPKKKFRS